MSDPSRRQPFYEAVGTMLQGADFDASFRALTQTLLKDAKAWASSQPSAGQTTMRRVAEDISTATALWQRGGEPGDEHLRFEGIAHLARELTAGKYSDARLTDAFGRRLDSLLMGWSKKL